jgi:hypothetical protein
MLSVFTTLIKKERFVMRPPHPPCPLLRPRQPIALEEFARGQHPATVPIEVGKDCIYSIQFSCV